MGHLRTWIGSFSVAALLLAAGPGRAEADVLAFAVDDSEYLDLLDLTTVTSRVVGRIGSLVGGGIDGLAISPEGTLYGVSVNGTLYTIDKATAAVHAVGSTGLGDVEGLRFRGDTLLGTDVGYANHATNFYAINTTTASPTLLVSLHPQQGATRAMTLMNPTTALIVTDSPTYQSLVSVNLTTGASTVIGALPTATIEGINGIDFAGGTLYGVGTFGHDYRIDPTTAGITDLGRISTQNYVDLAITTTVPEPSSSCLLGLMSVAALAIRSRSRRPAA